jgi:hypothetical protein
MSEFILFKNQQGNPIAIRRDCILVVWAQTPDLVKIEARQDAWVVQGPLWDVLQKLGMEPPDPPHTAVTRRRRRN